MPEIKLDEISVTGALHADALVSYAPGDPPMGVLAFSIHPLKGMPYFFAQAIGRDRDHHIRTETAARVLRKGAVVRVFGAGLRQQSDRGIAGLRLMEITEICIIPASQANGELLLVPVWTRHEEAPA